MDNENELPLSKILENILRSFFKIFSDIGVLAKTEARLAKQSVVGILFLSLLGVALLTTTWLCILGLLVTCLMSLNYSMLISILMVTVLNAVLSLLVCLFILRLKNNLFFRATRRQLHNTKNLLTGAPNGKNST